MKAIKYLEKRTVYLYLCVHVSVFLCVCVYVCVSVSVHVCVAMPSPTTKALTMPFLCLFIP